MYRKNFVGLDGFVWWFGVVENRKDPLMLNRVQVRIFGWHTENKVNIPSADLPWAHPVTPVSGSLTAAGPKEGDYVVGFFSDADSGQFPIIMGVIPGIPDTTPPISKGFSDQRTPADLATAPKKPVARNYVYDGSGLTISEGSATRYPNVLNEPTTSRLARHESIDKTIVQDRIKSLDKNVPIAGMGGGTWTEPNPAYNAKYPYNRATETESGHSFEMDDTPGAERITLTHRSGSFQEYYPSGTKVEKVVKSNYQIILGDDKIHIYGKCDITVNSDCNIKVYGTANIDAGQNINVRTPEDIKFKCRNFYVDASTTINLRAGTLIGGDAGSIFWNSGVAQSSGLSVPGPVTKNTKSPPAEPVPKI